MVRIVRAECGLGEKENLTSVRSYVSYSVSITRLIHSITPRSHDPVDDLYQSSQYSIEWVNKLPTAPLVVQLCNTFQMELPACPSENLLFFC